ncbi:ABC transporter permease [Microbacterium sp. LWO13-1.2]|uniref:ABC transporter permease n=1 Tax=Microbacterium sp. LWO13-1.2 TaxID=3135262 RepID=UPI003139E920
MVTLDVPLPRAQARLLRTDVPVGMVLAAGILILLIVMAITPALFTDTDPLRTDPLAAFQPPGAAHPFGTDQLGRDQFARVIHGARLSLGMGFGATVIGLIAGLALGLLAGLSRGWGDRVLSRLIDVLYAFPEMLLAIIAVAVLGTGFSTLLIAIGIGSIPSYARVLRSQVLQVRSSGYAESAVTLGQRPALIAWRHVLPNSIGPVLVLATIGVGTAIIFGSALSFVGLGAQPPTPEWGLMLSDSRNYLSLAPWLALWPGIFLAATVISVTVIGRWLQRRFVSPLGGRR